MWLRVFFLLICLGLLSITSRLKAEETEQNNTHSTYQLAEQFTSEFAQQHPDRILVIGVLDHGKRTYYSAGAMRSGSQPDQQTLFEIGSITKVFTGIALASLINQGTLELDQTIRTLIPDKVELIEPIGNITLKQLATHTSGLPRISLSTQLKALVSRQPYDSTREQLYANLAFLKQNSPTESPVYSNYGVSLLGDLMATVEDKTFEQIVIERICQPLMLHDTVENLSDDQQRRFAPGYFRNDPQEPWSNMGAGVAAGGFRSTAADLMSFASAVLEPPENALGEAIQLSLKPLVKQQGRRIRVGMCWHMVTPENHRENDTPKPDAVTDTQKQRPLTYYHNGSTYSHHSALHIVPEYDFAVVVFVNETLSDILNPDKVAYELIVARWKGE